MEASNQNGAVLKTNADLESDILAAASLGMTVVDWRRTQAAMDYLGQHYPKETAAVDAALRPRKAKPINLPVERLAALFGRYFGEPEREFRFHEDRRWRFDLAWKDKMLAVEYEGVFAAKSRHTTVTGYSNDAEKYTIASLLGWHVVRITALMLSDGRAESLAELAAVTLGKV